MSVDGQTPHPGPLPLGGEGVIEELLLDYQDFLRQGGLRVWEKDSPEAAGVRELYASDRSDIYGVATATAEVAANTLICMINQATFLLKRQIQSLERRFVEQGGFTERMHSVRTEQRHGEGAAPVPECPRCGKPMVERSVRSGINAGRMFWGCTGYPECRGTRSRE